MSKRPGNRGQAAARWHSIIDFSVTAVIGLCFCVTANAASLNPLARSFALDNPKVQGAAIGAGAGALVGKPIGLDMLSGAGLGAILGLLISNHYSTETLEKLFSDTGVHIIDDEKGAHLVLPSDILFHRGLDSTIDARYFWVLNKVAELLKDYPEVKLLVSGHTDDLLPIKERYELSMSQAKSVADYLMARGVAGSRLVGIEGQANDMPMLSEGSLSSRRANRRVEVSLLLSQPAAQQASRIIPLDPGMYYDEEEAVNLPSFGS